MAGLPSCNPRTIVDLGSGPGSLSLAASARWPCAKITTVDIDPSLSVVSPWGDQVRTHKRLDILVSRVSETLDISPDSAHLVISNPPYTRIAASDAVRKILQLGQLNEAVPRWTMLPADLVFLAQAIDLACPGGLIAFVVPDTLVSSDVMRNARRILMSNHRIVKVIQLPRRTFQRTDAQAFIIILEKGGTQEALRLCAVDASGREVGSMMISAASGVERLDWFYHCAADKTDLRPSLAELGVTVTRGRSNSRKVASSKVPIFHTCDFPSSPGEAVSFGSLARKVSAKPSGIVAEKGDILVARVDRRLERKVALVAAGVGEISDCVLRLRAPEETRERVLAGLVSEDGARQIVAVSRGTGARHISHKSILGIRV